MITKLKGLLKEAVGQEMVEKLLTLEDLFYTNKENERKTIETLDRLGSKDPAELTDQERMINNVAEPIHMAVVEKTVKAANNFIATLIWAASKVKNREQKEKIEALVDLKRTTFGINEATGYRYFENDAYEVFENSSINIIFNQDDLKKAEDKDAYVENATREALGLKEDDLLTIVDFEILSDDTAGGIATVYQTQVSYILPRGWNMMTRSTKKNKSQTR